MCADLPVSNDAAPAPTAPSTPEAPEPRCMRPPHRYRWAELMLRVFSIDVLHCPHCGARRRLIALITDLLVARRILRHLGLSCQAPAIAAARPPPQATFGF